jgi:type II secretory pathway pseudopilin PulG
MLNEVLKLAYPRLIMIVAIVLTATGCVIGDSYNEAQMRARECALETALKYVREAIKDYNRDHGKPPDQLEDLVPDYFNHIPIDPITNKADWTIEYQQCDPPTPCEKLIKDVHSSSTARSSEETAYSEW